MFSLKILLFKLYALKLKIATTIKKKKKRKRVNLQKEIILHNRMIY